MEKETLVDILEDINEKYHTWFDSMVAYANASNTYEASTPNALQTPDVITTSQEVYDFTKNLETIREKHLADGEVLTMTREAFYKAQRDLTEAIPLRNTWFRVSDGFVRLNDHEVIERISYGDMLKKLTDKRKED